MAKALVIDDSSTVRTIISKMLSSFGIESIHAGDGQEAFSLLEKSTDIEIAFVDWNMPVMNGLQFVKKVNSDSKYKDVKLVMVTTETELSQITTALECGVHEYIMKPFTPDAFKEKLALLGINVSES